VLLSGIIFSDNSRIASKFTFFFKQLRPIINCFLQDDNVNYDTQPTRDPDRTFNDIVATPRLLGCQQTLAIPQWKIRIVARDQIPCNCAEITHRYTGKHNQK